jgi:hypothetical protein
MTNDEKKEVLRVLGEIKLRGPFTGGSGLCFNISRMGAIDMHTVYDVLRIFSVDWEHFSGEHLYPISGEKVYNHPKSLGKHWEGEQLELRLSLIDHLIKKLREELGIGDDEETTNE